MSIWHDKHEAPEAGNDVLLDYGDGSYELSRGGYYTEVEDELPERWCYLSDLLALQAENERLRDLVKRWSCQYDMTDIMEPHQYELLRESEQALTNGGE